MCRTSIIVKGIYGNVQERGKDVRGKCGDGRNLGSLS
jgi:hypothetical protein